MLAPAGAGGASVIGVRGGAGATVGTVAPA